MKKSSYNDKNEKLCGVCKIYKLLDNFNNKIYKNGKKYLGNN